MKPIRDTTFKGTSGPWAVEYVYSGGASRRENGLVYAKIRAADGSVGFAGAYLSKDGKPNDEAKANAHLIAAAPELLAVAQAVVDIAEIPEDDERSRGRPGPLQTYDLAKAAIAKALPGQS